MTREKPRRLWVWGGILLLVLTFWARALVNLPAQSLTVDEPVHLVRGLAYWRTGDLRLQYGHPPLSHALIGVLPMLEPGVGSPAQMPGWEDARRLDVAQHLVWETPDSFVSRVTFLGRWPVVALGLLLAALSYRWAADLYGALAGLLALLVCTFDPNLLAHTSLATTDLTVTCMTFLASYVFFHWLRRPALRRLVPAGVALGLAWGAKMSSLVLLPVMGLAILWRAWRDNVRLVRLVGGFLGVLVISLGTVWAVYGFETADAAGWSIPMPTHWDNLRRLWQHQTTGHPAYFLGQLSQEGWWYYFPVLFLIKTPLALLLMVVVALILMRQVPRTSPPATAVLFPALTFGAAIISNINIGYRHILPVVPFLGLMASALWRRGLTRTRRLDVLSGALVLWMAASSLTVHSDYLTYFNEAVGGPDEGYRYAVDSNFDWGQDLKRVGRYVRVNRVDALRLSYFGTDRPSRYVDSYEVLPTVPFELEDPGFHPFNPDPGTYAISASHLQGLTMFDADIFDWFRRKDPVEKVGSIFVYRVEPVETEPTWAAVCGAPAPALSRERLVTGFGRDDLREVHFDCRSSWVYPAGRGSGWYVIPGQGDGSTVTDGFMGGRVPVFHGGPARSRPALTVYWCDGATDLSERLDSLSDRVKANDFGHVLTFLGSDRDRDDDPETPAMEVSLTTYWEVVNRPQEPLSIMAHLTRPDGSVLSVADGLGVPVENWAPGDVLAQVHTFAVPTGAAGGPYVPRIGLYWLASGEHVPLVDELGEILSLAELEVPNPSSRR